jgi:hypothetical protein
MQPDFGLAGVVLQMIEGRFGRRATNLLLILLYLALVTMSLYIIVVFLVMPVIAFVRAILPHALSVEVNTITIFYSSAFVAAAILMFPAIRFFWQQRRVPQRVIDDLAALRSRAIAEILNAKVSSDAELKTWEAKDEAWQNSVLGVLRKHFAKAEVLGFEYLGVIQQVGFPHSFSNEHAFRLMTVAKRLSILEDIIRRYTR